MYSVKLGNFRYKMPTNWWGRQNAAPVKKRPKAVGGGIFSCLFSNVNKCRSEADADVIYDVAVD